MVIEVDKGEEYSKEDLVEEDLSQTVL